MPFIAQKKCNASLNAVRYITSAQIKFRSMILIVFFYLIKTSHLRKPMRLTSQEKQRLAKQTT